MQVTLADLFPADLSPATVAVAGGPPEWARGSLFPEEERLIRDAVARRRRDFTAGRLFARQALATLGVAAAPIPAVERRPLWPRGTLGSITHTEGRCAAVAARVGEIVGIGLDVERRDAVTPALYRQVLTAAEADWLNGLAPALRPHWATWTFSAKEAFYKSLAEFGFGFVDFHDVRIRHADDGTFTVLVERPRLAALLDRVAVTGRTLAETDWLWTAVTLRRRG